MFPQCDLHTSPSPLFYSIQALPLTTVTASCLTSHHAPRQAVFPNYSVFSPLYIHTLPAHAVPPVWSDNHQQAPAPSKHYLPVLSSKAPLFSTPRA